VKGLLGHSIPDLGPARELKTPESHKGPSLEMAEWTGKVIVSRWMAWS